VGPVFKSFILILTLLTDFGFTSSRHPLVEAFFPITLFPSSRADFYSMNRVHLSVCFGFFLFLLLFLFSSQSPIPTIG